MGLCMGDRYHVFSVAFDIITFHVLTCTLIEQVLQVDVLVCNGTSQGPDCVSECNGWTLIWGS